MEKTKPNTTKACIHQSKEMYYNTEKQKPGLVLYGIRPGNGAGLFSKEKISKGGDEEKAKKKRIRGETYNINMQTIYTAPKSKIESRVHYA